MTDIDETQAAKLDATEPAPAEDPTQSIYAWSEHSDDDTEIFQRRSWKIPVAVAALATAAAVTTGVVMLWPEKTTPPPAQTPSVVAAPPPVVVQPPPPQTPDQRFISLLEQRGYHVASPALTIRSGHLVCDELADGTSTPQLVQNLLDADPVLKNKPNGVDTMSTYVQTAHEALCMQIP